MVERQRRQQISDLRSTCHHRDLHGVERSTRRLGQDRRSVRHDFRRFENGAISRSEGAGERAQESEKGAFQVPMMPIEPFGWYDTYAVAPS
ncbi:hypothetical protein GCM10020255_110070 [Rhodococcus baikonurensis]